MEAFLLGISTGGICLAYCAPALVPYLFGEGGGVGRNFRLLGQFLGGRLTGYLLFGVLAWGVHETVLRQRSGSELIIGVLYVAFSSLLIVYGFFKKHTHCAHDTAMPQVARLYQRRPLLVPFTGGFVTGLGFCPPFYLALSLAAAKESLFQSVLFFFLFFLGTALFFIPVPFAGMFRGYAVLRVIGRMAAGIVGIYYAYSGILMVIGGVKKI